ncbi:MAG: hypothetical protein L0J58_02420 [Micrococcaceae bacterium]|uniref:hypothetical protein n=1 Tax=Arthrobacter rhombi TaxID=71253 RepID=UPI00264CFC49|nr:hypothetical protein [Micrococcaceae bacterium]MDN5823206.1 hypothetical protein [Micrococcaceae bacterium]MDN5878997.1 hypothetical protein [Micrococcaceae bacterium]MDN5887299.1 hypothetical protein [Micrococcaceae bacterium]MDN5904815.1 hypothetical protein [Micrococcaceae bacterium]
MAEKEPTRSEARGPIPRWVWVLVAIVLVAGLVAGVSVFYAKTRKDETTAPAPSSAPTATAGGADGCIAGRDNDAKSLIEGAKKQAHTDEGAVGTAAGMVRWILQYPWPSEKEATDVMTTLSTVTDKEEIASSVAALRQFPAPDSARTGSITFADGRYVIESAEPDRVKVSVAGQGVADSQLTGKSAVMTLTMVWTNDTWKLAESDTDRTAEDALSNGVAFTGGC